MINAFYCTCFKIISDLVVKIKKEGLRPIVAKVFESYAKYVYVICKFRY